MMKNKTNYTNVDSSNSLWCALAKIMFNLNRNDEYKDMNIKKNFIISIEIHGIDFDIFAPVYMS